MSTPSEANMKYKNKHSRDSSNYYYNHKDSVIERINNWRKENPTKVLEYSKKANKKLRNKLKIEIFFLLGNQCNNPECPIPKEKMDINALQIDHVRNNGAEHRRLSGFSKGGSNAYLSSILKEIKNGSKDYQLLCAYCNWLKRLEK